MHDRVSPFRAAMVRLREQAGLSQREVARAMGFSAQYVCDVEKGGRSPGAAFVEALAGVFGCDARALHLLAGRVPEDLRPASLEEAERMVGAWWLW